jgi:hypothetical protein
MKRAVKTRFKGSPHRLSMGGRRNIRADLAGEKRMVWR